MLSLNRKKWIALYMICFGLILLIILQFPNLKQQLKVNILNVAQGDAIFIRTPEYHNILIDAGADSKIIDCLGGELPFFDKTIDIFILTHPHSDHYGGILDIMNKYKIKTVILTGVASNDPVYAEFLNIVRMRPPEAGVSVRFAQNDNDIQIGPNLFLDMIYPFAGQSLIGQIPQSANNTSIVARLLKRDKNEWKNLMILTGDAEQEEERDILLSGQDVKADILKVGHHGSKTATSNVFLSAVTPKTTVISAGKDNKFGHPHKETLDKLKAMELHRTDLEGAVYFNW